jgi:hypothetical protein
MKPAVKQLLKALLKKRVGNGTISKAQRKRLKEQRRQARQIKTSKPIDTGVEIDVVNPEPEPSAAG